MKISIIGAGAIGSAIARKLAKAGIDATIANQRGPASLQALVAELGPHITAVSAAEAAQADLVFVAVNWGGVQELLSSVGPWNNRILIDANNAVQVPSYQPVDLGGLASSEAVAQWAPGARVVKAFNHLIAAVLDSDPNVDGGKRVLFLSGEDADAKQTVSDLATTLGFAPIDLGGVQQGRLTQFPGGPLAIINLARLD
ncbi:Pyrroline-5-carboxylate reductase [Xanthomonas hydrangeae]|uniref:NADPH-dependent F420 reductase n=1 Tax=Xanthomonas hydrangeae TaxID=2775159 RepID=UPI001963D4E5|nr:Pyrroline-5-carboxylate reductase [Xanthomonas hydrangeae]CAD7712902.1 Pyrroline-5-carboxylate reductase [Xanthomonas hydrangeae]CAD7718373.1 Pyrroline-5-carboxylate reductase [Xanthomonas hydrangeae]CAD7718375.1 Pyrroline-5-carboxylate reductase [Xanthomonas hydrangeae]CAD7721950.1 Pyrroline-5-carboxylate reductase [Xanthomonas hydrangeae]